MNGYITYDTITKELLDSIMVGDVVTTNDSKLPLKVYGVSPNYFVMARRTFGKWIYSVCEKKLCDADYNAMRKGMFHIGTDDWIFGNPEGYDFTNSTMVSKYLNQFESGETKLSVRTSVPLNNISIKRVS